jgi:1-acyl-sn-glycerol-3-phosphate acyltransferase
VQEPLWKRSARRLVSIPGVLVAAVVLAAATLVWVPLAIVVDVARRRWRLPLLRLLAFALCWAWLESFAMVACMLTWITGQRNNRPVHYRLQAWWASALMTVLQATTGIRVLTKLDGLSPGPAVMICRHASLADSLTSAWAIISGAGLRPRYVLKKELLADPCLDVVGHRLPNHFLDRQAVDSGPELAALTRLTTGMGDGDVSVIFPEGTRASPHKRERALAAIARSDPERAQRLSALRHLLPPRPAGTIAMLQGAPDADLVVGWHSGFDGLDTFGGILRHLARRPPPVRFAVRRIPRHEVPSDPNVLAAWLDQVWLTADREVARLIEHDEPRNHDHRATDRVRSD